MSGGEQQPKIDIQSRLLAAGVGDVVRIAYATEGRHRRTLTTRISSAAESMKVADIRFELTSGDELIILGSLTKEGVAMHNISRDFKEPDISYLIPETNEPNPEWIGPLELHRPFVVLWYPEDPVRLRQEVFEGLEEVAYGGTP